MPRPVKWSRDVHSIRERAERSRTETWSRQDIERLFEISRPSAQNLMKAIGGVQPVGAAHFVDRASLLGFLDSMVAATSVDQALQQKFGEAEPIPKRTALRIPLPSDLRQAMMTDLPANITLEPGRLEIWSDSAASMLESLALLATIMQNDLDRFRRAIEPPKRTESDDELEQWLGRTREA